jgi:glycosyltransferase involved in cell wall biosynthesis
MSASALSITEASPVTRRVPESARRVRIGRPLRVAFDHQTFSMHPRGGVPKSFAETARLMASVDPQVDVRIGAWVTVNSHLRASGQWRGVSLPASRPTAVAAKLVNRALARSMLESADVIHCTYYQASELPELPRRPLVSTIHDFVPELLPHLFPHGNPHEGKASYIGRSDLLVCVSEVARGDLLRFHPEAAGKSVVVPHFIDPAYVQSARSIEGLPRRFALFVGVRDGYKNFGIVLHAMQRWLASAPDIDLVVAGDRPNESELNAIAALGLAGKVHFIRPNDRELAYVYGQAACFIYPSLAEGFGITTLEAMTMGSPPVLSRIPIFQEVGADAALYFDPHNDAELAERVLEASHTPDRAQRAAAARARAAEFTPQVTLPRLAAAWRSLVA